MRNIFLPIALIVLAGLNPTAASAQVPSVFTTGLQAPTKLITAGQSHLLVAETGTAVPNTGRISLVDRSTGVRRTLIDGLPSAFNQVEQAPSGPSGLKLNRLKLYVTIGQGDSVVPGTPSGIFPNPNPATPLNNAVLELTLPADYETMSSGFTLNFQGQLMLASGGRAVRLQNANGKTLIVQVVVNLPDHKPDIRPGVPEGNVRPANVFGIEIAAGQLYVVDASFNLLYKIDPAASGYAEFAAFAPKPNPLPFGPPFVEAVPDNVRLFGDQLVVSFLTGFPFAQNLAEVRSIDLTDGTNQVFLSSLTSAMDVLPVAVTNRKSVHYVLEFSTNMLAQPMPPGRLLLETPEGRIVVAASLISPTSMARDGETGDLYITEIFTGRIICVPGTFNPQNEMGSETADGSRRKQS